MTAVPNWDIVGPSGSDAELVRAFATGDRMAFAGIYDRYADRLYDFCAGMLGDRDGAADCVQDTFCIAATRLPQLRDPDKLRPWLYSIARNEALRRIRDRRRETPSEDLPDTASSEPGPDTLAARTELADLIADAAGGLSDRDRSVLELAFRHGLNGPDLAEALGVSPSNANTIVHRLRDTIERSLGALLVSRRVHNTGGCQDLAAILEGWDGHFNVLMRKRISRHIESCDVCDEERRRLVTPAALLGAAPVFIPAPDWLREQTLNEVALTSAAKPIGGDRHHGARDGKGLRLPVTLFVVALIAVMTMTYIWLNQTDTVITPTDLTETEPATSAPPPVPVAPPPSSAPTITTSVAAPPPPRTVVETSPPPVAPPVSEPPPPPPEEPPVVEPPQPPPPPPPPAWPDWLPQWPQWTPPVPPPPPPGGRFTGPGGLTGPTPDPPRGSSVQP